MTAKNRQTDIIIPAVAFVSPALLINSNQLALQFLILVMI